MNLIGDAPFGRISADTLMLAEHDIYLLIKTRR